MIDLSVNIVSPITPTYPTSFRRYTLIPDPNEPSKANLIIAPEYSFNNSNQELEDELFGQWVFIDETSYILTLFVSVGNDEFEVAKDRYDNFLEVLPDYVEALINAEKDFFKANPNLVSSNVSMRFISSHSQFNKTVYFCKIEDYLVL